MQEEKSEEDLRRSAEVEARILEDIERLEQEAAEEERAR